MSKPIFHFPPKKLKIDADITDGFVCSNKFSILTRRARLLIRIGLQHILYSLIFVACKMLFMSQGKIMYIYAHVF